MNTSESESHAQHRAWAWHAIRLSDTAWTESSQTSLLALAAEVAGYSPVGHALNSAGGKVWLVLPLHCRSSNELLLGGRFRGIRLVVGGVHTAGVAMSFIVPITLPIG